MRKLAVELIQEVGINEVISRVAYPNTMLRTFFDSVGKYTHSSRILTIRFEKSLFHRLKLPDIWDKNQQTPVFQ